MSPVGSEAKLSEQEESQLSAPPPLSDLDSSDSDSEPESKDAGQETEAEAVEWLATSRSRRATAGNRMKSMLANEEPDSDLELLFAESENDQGFSDVGDDASDVQMDSSSDDEDENNAGDDLEGEQELERQARERRAAQRKRKAQDAIPAKFRKKVRINPAASDTSTPAPAPRPKKKSERTSWLPSPADLPTRASSRKTTRMSKEQLHQQMIEREERRLKQLEQMQKKAAKMEALKKPPMTQEDRLREAAIVEKRNSKSLNRWEVAEKQREEERRAKLAALNQRTLKGPVITFWTGLGEARRVVIEEEKPKRRKVEKKPKEAEAVKDDAANPAADKHGKGDQQQTDASAKVAAGSDANASALQPKADPTEPRSREEQAAAVTESKATDTTPPVKQEDTGENLQPQEPLKPSPDASSRPPNDAVPPAAAATTGSSGPSTLAAPSSVLSPPSAPHAVTTSTVAKPSEELRQPSVASPPPPPPSHSGLAAPAAASPSGPPRQMSPLAAPAGIGSPRPIEASKPSSVLAPPMLAPPPVMSMDYRPSSAPKSNVLALPLPQTTLAPPIQGQTPPVPLAGAVHISNEPVLRHTVLRPINPDLEPISKSASPSLSEPPSQPAPAPAEVPEAPETTTRNVIIFQNFDSNAIQDKTIQTQILFGRKMTKLNKPPSSQNCVITNLPARYRDPETGLPYHNVAAYQELQRIKRGELSWSAILNAWVGSEKVAARGVPARFLDPNAPTKSPEEREKERLAQIRAVPPQPQPVQVQQQHQGPPAAVVAAAHKSPHVQQHVQQLQQSQAQRPSLPQQHRPQLPLHQQLAKPQQLQAPQQLQNRPASNLQAPIPQPSAPSTAPTVPPTLAPPQQSPLKVPAPQPVQILPPPAIQSPAQAAVPSPQAPSQPQPELQPQVQPQKEPAAEPQMPPVPQQGVQAAATSTQ
ncbi:transcriptional regulator family: YL1 nuclear protein [Trichoderma aggressivum f. europaeum]|uniref:Transcriptional regulator family: YL1 nuclear protein n=1 Tax=Trichoderma aggressivum f. europaeum TaxID=173218 RepID=A0AAE1JG02_9HYPO|nr:transcriptional regulator family: YL1 nuclear protein [Trichoderma aggressivum f. europaeum]